MIDKDDAGFVISIIVLALLGYSLVLASINKLYQRTIKLEAKVEALEAKVMKPEFTNKNRAP